MLGLVKRLNLVSNSSGMSITCRQQQGWQNAPGAQLCHMGSIHVCLHLLMPEMHAGSQHNGIRYAIVRTAMEISWLCSRCSNE